ncbi:hypothetical protein [Pseudarthrobacter sp. PH31-O2]|uniref:hypothetical protein n=1 Tax=Pseudarthrobacter sp. PH31-O2 TaxID=3046206 RepID=UPI0024BB19DE|nr:hypothetical protein [Pseudarthrobacter sp. PH31-O2]MDJ0354049.1 hypothetical protein [Pseudarthrobacter sp. PH31-O2]
MDFPLSSSVILVIAVALWIVWVAPYILRNGRHHLQPVGELVADVIDLEPAAPQAGKVMKMTAQQEKPMTSSQRTESVRGTTRLDGGRGPAATGPAFKIHFGRLALALAGSLSLLTGVVSALLGVFGLVSLWAPVIALLGTAAAVVVLRGLAVRDRRRKVNAAFRAAMSAPARQAAPAPARTPLRQSAGEPRERAENPLFDAQADDVEHPPAPKPLTAQDLREAAIAEAAASGDTSVRRAAGTPGVGESSWKPVEVPKPTYVEAPKAPRAAPEPLDLPEAPKAVGKPSLKQGVVQAPAGTTDTDSEQKPLGKAQSALSNLDDVLQRRRA